MNGHARSSERSRAAADAICDQRVWDASLQAVQRLWCPLCPACRDNQQLLSTENVNQLRSTFSAFRYNKLVVMLIPAVRIQSSSLPRYSFFKSWIISNGKHSESRSTIFSSRPMNSFTSEMPFSLCFCACMSDGRLRTYQI